MLQFFQDGTISIKLYENIIFLFENNLRVFNCWRKKGTRKKLPEKGTLEKNPRKKGPR